MDNQQQHTIRIANRIRQFVLAQEAARLPGALGNAGHLPQVCASFQSAHRRAQKALRRGWRLAARQSALEACRCLSEIRCALQLMPQDSGPAEPRTPTLRDMVGELEQLADEFDGWEYDQALAVLSVRTEAITLRDVPLGRFEVRLPIQPSSRTDPADRFSVVALDPNPAQGRFNVTHPHVNDDRLCAGDATGPIAAALNDGRICDFFLLVRGVLENYNPGSAHVRLEEWEGQSCHECGATVPSDDAFYCEGCEHHFCESCYSSCAFCESGGCMSCLGRCPHCEDAVCADCIKNCETCGLGYCPNCLKQGLCPECRNPNLDQDEEQTHEQQQQQPQEPATPVAQIA